MGVMADLHPPRKPLGGNGMVGLDPIPVCNSRDVVFFFFFSIIFQRYELAFQETFPHLFHLQQEQNTTSYIKVTLLLTNVALSHKQA